MSHTSTWALTNVTSHYAERIATLGFKEAIKRDKALALGVNTYKGNIVYGPVAEAHKLEYVALDRSLLATTAVHRLPEPAQRDRLSAAE